MRVCRVLVRVCRCLRECVCCSLPAVALCRSLCVALILSRRSCWCVRVRVSLPACRSAGICVSVIRCNSLTRRLSFSFVGLFVRGLRARHLPEEEKASGMQAPDSPALRSPLARCGQDRTALAGSASGAAVMLGGTNYSQICSDKSLGDPLLPSPPARSCLPACLPLPCWM